MEDHERTIAINNTTAHLSVLKSELSIVVRDLSRTLEEKQAADKQLAAVHTDITAATADLSRLYTQRDEVEKECATAHDKLGEREHTLAADQAAFDEYKAKETTAIDERKKNLDLAIAGKEDELTKLTTRLADISPIIEEKENILTALATKIADTFKDLNAVNAKTEAAQTLCDETVAATDKLIAAKKEELVAATAAVAAEVAKTTEPLANLKKREDAVTKKEHNLHILRTRFEQRWNKLYPDQKVII